MSRADAEGEKAGGDAPVRRPRARRRIPRWTMWVAALAGALTIAALVAAEYVVRNAEPMLRRRVIANLEQRFNAPVELDALDISLMKGLEVTGSGLKIGAVEGGDGASGSGGGAGSWVKAGATASGAGANGSGAGLAGAAASGAGTANAPPLLEADHFTFRAGLRELFEPTMRVLVVRVQGMRLRIPAMQEEQTGEQKGQAEPEMKRAKSRLREVGKLDMSKWKIAVDEVVCTDLTLTIESAEPGKQPRVFQVGELTLHDVGAGKAMPFSARLVNPKPTGDIESTGRFGPWRNDDPRETAVEGDYSFAHADLSTIKGISGTLSSTGRYGGSLGEIHVTGTTDTPDFALDLSEHPVELRTQFDATVDGTTGDTILNAVHATLLHTELDVKGRVVRVGVGEGRAAKAGDAQGGAVRVSDAAGGAVRAGDAAGGAVKSGDAQDGAVRAGDAEGGNAAGETGHLIEIAVVIDKARVEDLLTVAAKHKPPLVNGALMLRASLTIPPGHVSVTQKMQVAGRFAVHGAGFSNAQWQETVDKLSERARGNPEQANAQSAERVASEMEGSFELAHATLKMSRMEYRMPGAEVDLTGTYGLDGRTFDFAGTARTEARASDMLTGWKSIVAMPLDKLLEKNGAGVQVPIKIEGTESAPKMKVDLGKLTDQIFHKKKDDAQQPGANQAQEKHP